MVESQQVQDTSMVDSPEVTTVSVLLALLEQELLEEQLGSMEPLSVMDT